MSLLKRILSTITKISIGFFVVTILWVIVYRFVPVPLTFLMLQRIVENKIAGKEVVFKKDWEPIENISKHLALAVVAAEDQRFLEHRGFDFEAIQKAAKYNEKQKSRNRKKVRGASTISQQTAKNVFLWPGRSYIRKAFEVYFTVLIEVLWSKERIMEVYLNVIEMGNGVYGAEAASEYFFKKPASKLSKAESARLAAVLPNPRRYKAGSPSPYIIKRQIAIQRQMEQLGGVLIFE